MWTQLRRAGETPEAHSDIRTLGGGAGRQPRPGSGVFGGNSLLPSPGRDGAPTRLLFRTHYMSVRRGHLWTETELRVRSPNCFPGPLLVLLTFGPEPRLTPWPTSWLL